MRVADKGPLAAYQGKGMCEWCRRSYLVRHAAHVYARGMGGGSTLNHPWNLVSLCWQCHWNNHNAREPTRQDLLKVVAWREQLRPEELLRELHRMLRLDKWGREPHRTEE